MGLYEDKGVFGPVITQFGGVDVDCQLWQLKAFAGSETIYASTLLLVCKVLIRGHFKQPASYLDYRSLFRAMRGIVFGNSERLKEN